MRYTVLFKPSAKRQFESLDASVRERIAAKISALAENPFPAGCKKLTGDEAYRIRIGDWRVIFDVLESEIVVLVLRIGHRREVYR